MSLAEVLAELDLVDRYAAAFANAGIGDDGLNRARGDADAVAQIVQAVSLRGGSATIFTRRMMQPIVPKEVEQFGDDPRHRERPTSSRSPMADANAAAVTSAVANSAHAILARVRKLQRASAQEQKAFWRGHFAAADADSNTVLDPEEAKVAVAQMIGDIFRCGESWQPSQRKLDAVFAKCDMNRDGVLQEHEFALYFAVLLRGMAVYLEKRVSLEPAPNKQKGRSEAPSWKHSTPFFVTESGSLQRSDYEELNARDRYAFDKYRKKLEQWCASGKAAEVAQVLATEFATGVPAVRTSDKCVLYDWMFPCMKSLADGRHAWAKWDYSEGDFDGDLCARCGVTAGGMMVPGFAKAFRAKAGQGDSDAITWGT